MLFLVIVLLGSIWGQFLVLVLPAEALVLLPRAVRPRPFGVRGRSAAASLHDIVVDYRPSFSKTNKTKSKVRRAPNKRTQLRWIAQSVERLLLEDDNSNNIRNHQLLLRALEDLSKARTQSQRIKVGCRLEAMHHSSSWPLAVKERILKAAAMTGLDQLVFLILDSMLDDNKMLPSAQAQDAVCNYLRYSGQFERLQETLRKLGTVANASDTFVSTASFNIYLAALCDMATGKRPISKELNQTRSNCLQTAADYLLDSDRCDFGMIRLQPDAISYATVLQAATRVENLTLAHLLWDKLILPTTNISLTTDLYNARLRMASDSSYTRQQQRDQQVLHILDNEFATHNLQPDRYTIDLVLLPLIRQGRMGDVLDMLDSFVASHTPTVSSQAFGAFLQTLTQAGEVSTARALLDTYMLPTLLSPVHVSNSVANEHLVRPTSRHLNVLLEGYRRQCEVIARKGDKRDEHSFNTTTTATKEAWELYHIMLQSSESCCRPDSYTITSMMGLCHSSTDLTNLLQDAVNKLELNMTSVVLRAAMTAYGKLGDPSSACWMYARFFVGRRDILRTWNVLLGAIADSIRLHQTEPLDILNSQAGRILLHTNSQPDEMLHQQVIHLFDGRTCLQAIERVMADMNDQSCVSADLLLPSPNSQTYCIVASALQHGPCNADLAMEIFRNATGSGIPADGRFINSVIRCFGDDIDAALLAWKSHFRRACLAHENRPRQSPLSRHRTKGKNLLAAYHGLLYVCGRAFRPDVALRLVYAMKREGLEPTEMSLNCYQSGKRMRQQRLKDNVEGLALKLRRLVNPYESLLYVECMKYDENDKRRVGEKRVRIIV